MNEIEWSYDDPPEVNIPELRKAVEWVEVEDARPEVESTWRQRTYYTSGNSIGRTCDTAYCVAGYVVSLHYSYVEMLQMGEVAVDNRAKKILGLTYEEGVRLFNAHNDAKDVRRIAEYIAARAGEKL